MNEMLRLIKLFRPYWGWAALGIIVSYISVMANIVLLAVSGWFITIMGLAGVTGMAVNYFTPSAIIRACAILRTGGRYLERVITHEATFRFMAEMRSWLYHQIEAMPLSRSSRYHSGDLLARLRGDIDTLESFYINWITPCCVAFLACLTVGISFTAYDIRLALVHLGLLSLAGLAIPYVVYITSKTAVATLADERGQLKIQMVENIQSHAEMVIYGLAEPRMTKAMDTSQHVITRQRHIAQQESLGQAATGLITNIGMVIILCLTIMLFQNDQLKAAQIPMLTLFALASYEAVLPLSLAFQSFENSRQAARRIFELASNNTQNDAMDQAAWPIAVTDDFTLHADQIDFAYDQRPVLEQLSFSLNKGECLLIKGPSGIGKSSLLQLLVGLYAPTNGTLTLNGARYSDLTGDTIRHYYSVVPQRPYLFNGTIRTNLLIAKPDATSDEMIEACRIACFDLTKGLDDYIGEGGNTLSGGEIRRLAIVRAVLKNAPCLLLDEPTESLDQGTAAQLLDNLFAYAQDKAMIIISHDPLPEQRFNQIIHLR